MYYSVIIIAHLVQQTGIFGKKSDFDHENYQGLFLSFDRSTYHICTNVIYNIFRSGNCPRFRANHDSFVSSADRARIHEIRGPPH